MDVHLQLKNRAPVAGVGRRPGLVAALILDGNSQIRFLKPMEAERVMKTGRARVRARSFA